MWSPSATSVVGDGSAGCLLATGVDRGWRFIGSASGSRWPGWRPRLRVPVAVHPIGSEHYWASTSDPQEFTGRTVRVPRGRTLGGSSSPNAMFYSRGNRAVDDRWRDAHCAHMVATGVAYRLTGEEAIVRGAVVPISEHWHWLGRGPRVVKTAVPTMHRIPTGAGKFESIRFRRQVVNHDDNTTAGNLAAGGLAGARRLARRVELGESAT